MNIQDAFINALCENADRKASKMGTKHYLNESSTVSEYGAICIREKESNYLVCVIMVNKKHSLEDFEGYLIHIKTQVRIEFGEDNIEEVLSRLDHNKYDFYVISDKNSLDTLYV